MNEHFSRDERWNKLGNNIHGLGEISHQKEDLPVFRNRLNELERLYLILDYSIDAIFRVELPSGKITDMNKTSRDLFSSNNNSGSIVLFRDIIGDDSKKIIDEFFLSEPDKIKKSIKIETTLKTPDGHILPVEMTIGIHSIESDSFALVIARDLTERKVAEASVKKSEEKYRAYITNSPDAIFVTDGKGNYIEANPAACLITGYSEDEIKKLNVADIMKFSEKDAPGKIYKVLKKNGKICEELHFIRKDKSEIIVMVDAVKISEDRYVKFCRDITERKTYESSLQRLATAIEQAAEDVMITDPQGLIEFVNPAFERITGYTREEVIGKNPKFLKSGKHDHEFYDDLWNTIKNGNVWTGVFSNKRKDDRIIEEETTISPIFDNEKKIIAYVALKRDVTEQAKLEVMYRQSQKMEAIGLLAGGVAHDFNNLLQAMQGYADMALMELPHDSPVRSDLDEVVKASNKAKSLIRQLLTFSRKDTLLKESLDLNDIIYNLMKMLRRVIGEHIELQINLAPSLKKIHADPGQIEQIVMNLCVNARDAMPDGGKIIIETGNVYFSEEYRMLNKWAKSGYYAKLSIADSGVGIPKELQEKIFEPFFTTKNLGEGTGLGLATVYAIAERHGGLINLYSEPSKGTIFRLYFPAYEKPESHSEKNDVIDNDLLYFSQSSETILFAEDDDQIRKLSVKLLEKYGYNVLVARNGEEAVHLIEKYRDKIHIAVLDVVMPRKSGRFVYDRLMELSLNIPVIFSSGYSFDALRDREMVGEKMNMIQKPYAPKDLLGKIKEVLENKNK